MTWHPTITLYASNGSTVIYTFEYIQSIDGYPGDLPSNIEISNLRSQGSIIIPGGQKSYDITLHGILIASDYSGLTTKIKDLFDAIDANTNYVLKIEKSISTSDSINVMRIIPIIFDTSNRTTSQKYSVTFKALSW